MRSCYLLRTSFKIAPEVVDAGVFLPEPGGVRELSDGAANVGKV